jgi:O-antigen/teichoic acid export membrane protein
LSLTDRDNSEPVAPQPSTRARDSAPVQTFVRSGFRIVSAAAVLVTLHIATRYFGAGEWGVYVTASAIIVLFGVIEDFGLQTVIAREISADPSRRDILFTSSLLLRVTLAVVAVGVSIGITAALFPGRATLLLTVVVLTPTLVADAVQSASASILQASSRLGMVGVVELVVSTAGIPAALLGEHLRLSIDVFALLMSAGAVLAGAVAIALALRYVSFSTFALKKEWSGLVRVTLPFGIVLLISTTYAQIDTLIVAALRPAREVGFYGVATLMMQLAASGPSFLMAALLPAFATSKPDALGRMVRGALDDLFFWFLPPLVAGALLAPAIVEAISGKSFADASTPLVILLLGTILTLPTAAFGNALVASSEESRLVPVGLVVLVFNIGLNFALVPHFGIIGASVALVASESVAFALTAAIFRKLHGISPVPPRLLDNLLAGVAPVVGWALLVPTHVSDPRPLVRLVEVLPLMAVLVIGVDILTRSRRRKAPS